MATSSNASGQVIPPAAARLRKRLDDRTATIGIIGLGYVGLPLARAVHDAGFNVVGFDVDATKLEKLARGEMYLEHLGTDLARELAASDRFTGTTDPTALGPLDVAIICVPTPLGPHREPDLSYVLQSARMLADTLTAGQLIVLESTTYPGTTRQDMLPILEETGLRCGEDFFVAYSPEREDPGRADTSTSTIPKLVGGLDDISTDLAVAMYKQAIDSVHRVDTAEIAEAAKILENVYRAVNIAMVNELKVLFTDMDIDVWKVVEAASTKPFGFQPFYPGPGLGGHCIPIDPFYLTWKAKEIGQTTRFIELAGEINAAMPRYVITRLTNALNDIGRSLRDSKVLILGVAYKPNVDDIRESPAAEIIQLLQKHRADVSYHDPHVHQFPPMRHYNIELSSVELSAETLAAADCVLIVTDHAAVDYELVGKHATLIVDTRNAMASVSEITGTLVKA